ncbi:hypothetical protein F8388_022809 [Cannabis sativa]|uniref:Uncharacterized protein n=1 Tax=Cannabis sativa TaxID=3483 RepID=A0A7J6FBV6_CANSA|nr:hypothetical protein F8388_022809 [Cannabis sativa]
MLTLDQLQEMHLEIAWKMAKVSPSIGEPAEIFTEKASIALPWSSKERIARKASLLLVAASTKILTKDPVHSLSKLGTTVG